MSDASRHVFEREVLAYTAQGRLMVAETRKTGSVGKKGKSHAVD